MFLHSAKNFDSENESSNESNDSEIIAHDASDDEQQPVSDERINLVAVERIVALKSWQTRVL